MRWAEDQDLQFGADIGWHRKKEPLTFACLFQEGIEEFDDKLLVFAGEAAELFKVQRQLRGRTGPAARRLGLTP